MKAAHEKAQALAHALGQEIGKAYAIEEIPESTYGSTGRYGYLSNVQYESAPDKARVGPSTAIGEKKVAASVIVLFDLN